jgi:hypothetical protein
MTDKLTTFWLREVTWASGLPQPIGEWQAFQAASVGDEARRTLALLGHVSGRHFELRASPPGVA